MGQNNPRQSEDSTSDEDFHYVLNFAVAIYMLFLFHYFYPKGERRGCATIVVLVKCYCVDCLRSSCLYVINITDVAVFINLIGAIKIVPFWL